MCFSWSSSWLSPHPAALATDGHGRTLTGVSEVTRGHHREKWNKDVWVSSEFEWRFTAMALQLVKIKILISCAFCSQNTTRVCSVRALEMPACRVCEKWIHFDGTSHPPWYSAVLDWHEGHFTPYIISLLEILALLALLLPLDLSSLTCRHQPYQDHYQTISGFHWPNAWRQESTARASLYLIVNKAQPLLN